MPGEAPVLVRILLSDFKHNAETVGSGHFAVTGFELQAEVRTHIKGFQVRNHGGTYYIEAPEQEDEQYGIIDIPSELVPVKTERFLAKGLKVGFDLCVQCGVGSKNPHIISYPVSKAGILIVFIIVK